MKEISIYLAVGFITVSVFCTACSVSKEAGAQKQTINGDWTLQSINVEGLTGSFNTKVFNEANSKCFIGSNWNFFSNISSGTYNLTDSTNGCIAIKRNIKWSIYEPKNEGKKFQFKRLDLKGNAMDDNNGFRLNITSLTKTDMQLTSAVTTNSKPVTVVFNFTKK